MLKPYKFAIFDMDGTIINSMPAWKTLWSEYLISKGVEPPELSLIHI